MIGAFYLVLYGLIASAIAHSDLSTDVADISDAALARESSRMLRQTIEDRKPKEGFKKKRTQRVVNFLEHYDFPMKLYPHEWSPAHNASSPAIFSIALIKTLMGRDAVNFIGTARKAGFKGDIVIAVYPDMRDDFIAEAKKLSAITYVVPTVCTKSSNDVTCRFEGQTEQSSINMLRYHLYQYWSLKYEPESIIMLSDFSDAFFQADPIAYRQWEWYPTFQLVAYQEAHPNMVINRCLYNSGWIRNCYGEKALRKVGSNTVSCSGTTMGTRDAVLVYTYLMTKQMNPIVRHGGQNITNPRCTSVGMDQGFHNWLLYSGILSNYVDVKIYQQGEGSVNTMGGFYGDRKILKMSLADWKIVRGTAPNKVVYNWNGDPSPLIHQMDRFKASQELEGGYKKHLAIFQGLDTF